MKKFKTYNRTKWTAIIAGIVAAAGSILNAIFDVVELF